MSRLRHLPTLGLMLIIATVTFIPAVWTLHSTPVAGISWSLGNGKAQRAYETRFEQSFPFGQEISEAWAALRLHVFGELADGAVLGQNGVLFTAEEFTVPSDQVNFSEQLRDAQTKLAAKGINLLPIIIPDKARMQATALGRARSDAYQTRYDNSLAAVRALGLRTVDLRQSLSGTGAFLTTDTHWSPTGSRNAATAIADELRGFQIDRTPFETTQTGWSDWDGDLTVFAATGRWRSRVGPTQDRIETFETMAPQSAEDDGAGLFGDTAIPVALVGTSFSAKPEFHFEGFLKSALQADVLNHALIGKGPFDPMRVYLDQLNSAPALPTLVIWEIPERYITPIF